MPHRRPPTSSPSLSSALAFGEPEAERARDLLLDAELYAPTLLPYELASVARKKSMRHPDRRESIARALSAALELDLRLLDVSHPDVLTLALETGLTTCDATHLYVSRLLDIPLAAFDAHLADLAGS